MPGPTFKIPIALLTIITLGGCSSQHNVWAEYAQLIRQSLRGSTGGSAITREQAAAIPYATLGYRIDGGSEAILVLATDADDEQMWTAASHIVLLTRGGRIVRSIGLPHDRGGMVSLETGMIPPLDRALKSSFRSNRLVDLPDIMAYSVPLSCVTMARGLQTITILGAKLPTVRVDESCQSTNPRWSFTDSFWLDSKTGFVWQSVQHLNPAGGSVQTEVLRPPG